MQKKRYIAHVDMDAFFAAIEERDDPQLKGKPIVVGADPKAGRGRGVVSTCSYAARKFGIHSAMPISIAYRKCPHAVFLPVNMERYAKESKKIYKILYGFTPQIEPIGIDEAFLDITGSYHLFGAPLETCLLIKSRIRKEMGLIASIGLAPTKMVAKIASDLKKPDGMVEVSQEGLLDFLWPLDIEKIWGLGKKSKEALNSMEISTIGDLAKRDVNDLVRSFGKNGAHFWELANGIDPREVETEEEVKSISNEHTFEADTWDKNKIYSTLMLLAEKVSTRARKESLKGRTITLKIRLEGFKTFTRSNTLAESTNLAGHIYKEIKRLYDAFDAKRKRIRLLGVKLSNLCGANVRDTLFRKKSDGGKEEKIQKAMDYIKQEFGTDSIHFATGSTQDGGDD